MHPKARAAIEKIAHRYRVEPEALTGRIGRRKSSHVTAARDALVAELWDSSTFGETGHKSQFRWNIAEIARQLDLIPENVRAGLIRSGVYFAPVRDAA